MIHEPECRVPADAEASTPCQTCSAILNAHQRGRRDAAKIIAALHSPTGYKATRGNSDAVTGLWCAACADVSMGEYGQPYPCPTVKALSEIL